MKRKSISRGLKYGLILGIYSIIYPLIGLFVDLTHAPVDAFLVLTVPFLPIVYLTLPLIYGIGYFFHHHETVGLIIYAILTFLIFFFIGKFIGFLIDKIRMKK